MYNLITSLEMQIKTFLILVFLNYSYRLNRVLIERGVKTSSIDMTLPVSHPCLCGFGCKCGEICCTLAQTPSGLH